MKLFTVALAFLATSAFAAKVEFTEIDYNDVPAKNYITMEYGINPSMNRAWVEITLEQPGDQNFTFLRSQVPGLSIVGDAVVLEVEGQQVECARLRRGRIFRRLSAHETKNCRFVVGVKKTQVDDGFEVRTRKSYALSIETK